MSVLAVLSRRFSPIFREIPYRSLASRSTATQMKNEDIRFVPTVRLISESGKDCGVMSGKEAYNRAQEVGKDIVQVGGGLTNKNVSDNKYEKNSTVIVRMIDLAAHQEVRRKKAYEIRKSRKENKMIERKESMLKQIRFSPATDTNDRLIKMRKAKDFLMTGYRVKVYMQFRRGQGRLQEDAKNNLISAAEELQELGKIQGLAPDGQIADLFKPKQEEDTETKSRPQLNFIIQPLSRKVREQISKQDDDCVT